MPIRWMKLESLIYTEAEKLGNVLSIDKATELASSYQISGEEFEEFIKFHHILGDILHFKHTGLKNFLITSPCWLIRLFASIIHAPHDEKELALSHELRNLDEQGILHTNLATQLWNDIHIGINPHLIWDLLVKFDLVFPMKHGNMHESTINEQYIVPSMLPICDLLEAEEMLKQSDSMHRIVAPLYLKFAGNFIPMGTFQKLVCRCCHLPGWTQHGPMFYNMATFLTGQACDFMIRLTLHNVAIRVECFSPVALPASQQPSISILPSIANRIVQSLEATCRRMKFDTCILPCTQKGNDIPDKCFISSKNILHSTGFTDSSQPSYPAIMCPNHMQSLQPEDYAPWFTVIPLEGPYKIPLDTQKYLKKLAKRISTEIRFWELGLSLDVESYQMDSIRTDHRDSIQQAGFYLLLYWYINIWSKPGNYRDDVAFHEILEASYQECGIEWQPSLQVSSESFV